MLIAAFAVVGYAAQWIKFDHDGQQEKATVEIDTGEVQSAAESAIEKTKELIEDAGKEIEKVGDDPQEDADSKGDTIDETAPTESDDQPGAVRPVQDEK